MPDYSEFKSEAGVAASLALEQAHLQFANINEQTILVSPTARTLSLEQFEAGRNRKRGCFHTQNIDSFIGYVEGNAEPEDVTVFIDQDSMEAVAILNFGAKDFEQGHLDHRAVLRAEATVTFKKLLAMHDSGRCKQKVFAEFLEDWGDQVVARDENGNEIENAKAVNSIRNMSIAENAQTDSSVGSYRETRSRLESVEAKSIDGALPAYFTVTDDCYQGLPSRTLRLRLGISNDDGQPVFKIDIVGLQIIKDELAKEFAALVEDGLMGEIGVGIGQFKG